jgi:hypothetical protein
MKLGIFINYDHISPHLFHHAYVQAENLSKLGHDVYLITSGHPDLANHECSRTVVFSSTFIDLCNNLRLFNFSSEKITSIATNSFDVWIFHSYPFYSLIQYVDAPVIYVEYGSIPSYLLDQMHAYCNWKVKADHFTKDMGYLRESDAVICLFDHVHSDLPDSIKHLSTVINPMIIGSSAVNTHSISIFKENLKVNKNTFVIGLIGGMQLADASSSNTLFSEYFRVVEQLKNIFSDVVYVAIGNFSEEERNTLGSCRILTYECSHYNTYSFLLAVSNLVVSVTKINGLEMLISEAQCYGIPVIAFDTPCNKKLFENSQTINLVEQFDETYIDAELYMKSCNTNHEHLNRSSQFNEKVSSQSPIDHVNNIIMICREKYVSKCPPERFSIYATHISHDYTSPAQFSLKELLALNDKKFVDAVYNTLLGRPADTIGEAWVLETLNNFNINRTVSKFHVLIELSRSSEGRKHRKGPFRLRIYSYLGLSAQFAQYIEKYFN